MGAEPIHPPFEVVLEGYLWPIGTPRPLDRNRSTATCCLPRCSNQLRTSIESCTVRSRASCRYRLPRNATCVLSFLCCKGAAKRMRHRTPIAGSELRGKLIQTASIAPSAVTLEHCPGRSDMREQL